MTRVVILPSQMLLSIVDPNARVYVSSEVHRVEPISLYSLPGPGMILTAKILWCLCFEYSLYVLLHWAYLLGDAVSHVLY